MENETQTLFDLEYVEKPSKTWKMRNVHYREWNIARKLKNMGNEKQTLFDLEYKEKLSKTWKIKNTHCRIWITAKKKTEKCGK
jgi:hypothetical protein